MHDLEIAALTTPNPPVSGSAIAKASSTWQQQAAVVNTKTGYDPLNFYVRSTDTRGHGEKIGGRVPPEVYHQIMQLIASDLMPEYTCVMDVVRDGIVHLLRMRSGQIGDVAMRDRLRGFVDHMTYLESQARTKYELELFDQAEKNLQELMVRFNRDGAYEQMVAMLDEAEEFWCGRGQPYRTKMLDIVRRWRAELPPQWR